MTAKKKFFYTFFTLILVVFSGLLYGCEKEPFLYNYLSDYRENLYYGENEDIKLKACYGIRESDRNNDGTISNRYHYFSFVLLEKEHSNTSYSISLTINDITLSENFSLSPVSGNLCALIEVEPTSLTEFEVSISYSSSVKNVPLKSILPEDYIDGKEALKILESNQKNLIESYKDKNGFFEAEVTARIIVKDDKPYWYIAFIKSSDNVKALLLDGLNGEVLAVRDVF